MQVQIFRALDPIEGLTAQDKREITGSEIN